MPRILGLAVLLSGCASLGTHEVRTVSTPVSSAAGSWDTTFAHPTALRVTAFRTGEVFTGPRILIDEDNPRTPEADKVDRWVPSIAYLVEHPTQGALLLDTGVTPVTRGSCAYGLRPFYWVPCRTTEGQDAVSQLHQRGLSSRNLRYAVMSHFHGDHAGGLAALVADGLPSVLTTEPEWTSVGGAARVTRGYVTEQLQGTYAVGVLDQATTVVMPHVERAWDLFGDGSVWLIPTAGHTEGGLAALLNTQDGPILLTFDASHLAANFNALVIPGSVTDEAAASSDLQRLRALRDAYPALRVLFGHEPSQWLDPAKTVELARPRSADNGMTD